MSKIAKDLNDFIYSKNDEQITIEGIKDETVNEVIIPNGVTTIRVCAFYGCTSLTSVTIPDSVTTIGEYAFSDCTSLKYNEYHNAYYLGNDNNPYVVLVKAKSKNITSCEINENCKFIHSKAFFKCTSLTNITIPNSVITIGEHAFSKCSSLTIVYYLGTQTEWINISIQSNNGPLESAAKYYYSKTQPTDTTYNYWHYVDGIPTAW